jgi:hypothetical protein
VGNVLCVSVIVMDNFQRIRRTGRGVLMDETEQARLIMRVKKMLLKSMLLGNERGSL